MVEGVSYACLVFCGGYSVTSTALQSEEQDRQRRESDPSLDGLDDYDDSELQSRLLNGGEDGATAAAAMTPRQVIVTILVIDALCTVASSFCGGLLQTTPYIGYPTYKKLGAGRDYSWMFSLLLLLLTTSGTMSYLAQALPQPVLKPIFILIALQMAESAFGLYTSPTSSSLLPPQTFKTPSQTTSSGRRTPPEREEGPAADVAFNHNRYIPAIAMTLFPAIADMMVINGSTDEHVLVIAKGFLITSILWGQVTLSILEGKRTQSAALFTVLCFLTFFGFIHSMDGKVYYDVWNHPTGTNPQNGGLPYSYPFLATYAMIGYGFCAAMSFIFVPGASTQ